MKFGMFIYGQYKLMALAPSMMKILLGLFLKMKLREIKTLENLVENLLQELSSLRTDLQLSFYHLLNQSQADKRMFQVLHQLTLCLSLIEKVMLKE